MPLHMQRRYRHFRRYRKIAEVLLRHGFGFVVEQLDLTYFARWRRRWRAAPPVSEASRGERLRLALEELGPTFIKLGQLLSSRPDVVPTDVADELTLLQDHVPPEPFVRVRALIEAELDTTIEQAFARFDVEPVAAASIGQVHKAILHDGTEVAVKVLRPGIEEAIATDLEIMATIARLAEERLQTERFSPVAVVDEFHRVLRREMDFRLEATACERFRHMFAGDGRVLIPKVHWEWTTERVFVMQFVHGAKVTDAKALHDAGTDPAAVAKLGAEIFLHQVLIEGFFHGDPHPGNLFIAPDGRLAVLDFGVVGRLDEKLIAAVTELFVGVTQRDVERVLRGLSRIGATEGVVDRGQLRSDIHDIIDRYHGRRLKELELGPIVDELMGLIHRNRLSLPTDLLLLSKALVTLEGLGKSLDPDFNALEIAGPFAQKLLRRRLDPEAFVRRTARDGLAYVDLLAGLPTKMDVALTRLNHGDARIRIVIEGLDRSARRMERTGNRLVAAVVLGTLVLATGNVFQAQVGPLFRGWPVLGLLGIVASAFTAFGLVIAVLRSGRL